MKSYTFFDAHCDTLSRICDSGENLRKNPFHIDLERLGTYGGYVQTFAAFVDKKRWQKPSLRVKQQIDAYHSEIRKNADTIVHCINACEIENALKAGKIAALLSIEGGEAIEGSLEKLREFYNMGVRMMTLTWNYENEICDGIGEARGGGLTEFGKNAVREMNRMGMIVDVSHISYKGFRDVADISDKPIIASHSNAKRLCPHPRNLDDEQIKAVFEMDGCIGVNFYPEFVSGKSCCVDEVVNHIEHFLDLGGENNIGLGSDFDGISTLPEGMSGSADMRRVVDGMLKRGFKDELISKITHENFMRVINRVLK